MMEKQVGDYDVVIIGGGAAGLTAGIYCGRARLKTLLIEESLVGGLATSTNEIENYPGFPQPLSGIGLMKLFEEQAKRLGVAFKLTAVKGLRVLADGMKLVETFRADYRAKVVIIATGGKPRLTGAKNEADFLYGKGISFCATCDAAYYTDKVVLVVGSGDAAIEEGLYLTRFARKVMVSVIHDPGTVDANQIAREQAFANPKLEFLWNTLVEEFRGTDRLEQVVLKHTKTGASVTVDVDGCFLFIGYLPNSELFQGLVELDPRGYIKTNDQMETNIEGVYAVGDVREKALRQVATAVGDGAVAAVAAEHYLAETESWRDLIGGARPALLYVWEPTSESCRGLLPTVEELKSQFAPELCVSKIDVYKSEKLVSKICIPKPDRLPAVVLMKNGKPVELVCENLTPASLKTLAQKVLAER